MLMAQLRRGTFPVPRPRRGRVRHGAPGRATSCSGLDEKHVLKRAFADVVPRSHPAAAEAAVSSPGRVCVLRRRRHARVAGRGRLAGARSVTPASSTPRTVDALVAKCLRTHGVRMSNTDNMRILAVISTQLLHRQFVVDGGERRVRGRETCRTDDGHRHPRSREEHRVNANQFGPEALKLDLEEETERIGRSLRTYLEDVRRRGVVVALSGGIDSSAGRRGRGAHARCRTGLRPPHARARVFRRDDHDQPGGLRPRSASTRSSRTSPSRWKPSALPPTRRGRAARVPGLRPRLQVEDRAALGGRVRRLPPVLGRGGRSRRQREATA